MTSKQRNIRFKIKHILPATIATLLISTAIYALIRWICLTYGFESIKEEAWRIYLPSLLSAMLVFGLLSPRIRIIQDSGSRTNPRDFIYLIVLLTGIIMLGTAQGVVTYKCATTTQIESLGNGSNLPRSRYYHLEDNSIERFARGAYAESRTISQRYGSYLQFHLYVVYPFEGQRKIWYGLHYQKDYKEKNASDEEVQNAWSHFITNCESKLNTREIIPQNRLERVLTSNAQDGYFGAIRNAQNLGPQDNIEEIVVLTEVETIAEDRWVENANALIWSFLIGMSILIFMLILAPIDRERINREGKLKAIRQESSFLSILQLSKPENWLIAGLVAIMIGVFVAMTIVGVDPLSPSNRELIKWGGANHAQVFNGAWWLLFSAIFVHAGFLHLGGNLVTLFLGLLFSTTLFSGPKTAFIFILSGFCSILAAVTPPDSAVVGASGAIMGIYGAALAASLSSKKRRQRTGIGFWLLFGVVGLTLVVGMSSGISNIGHIAGLLSGAVLGLLLVKKDTSRPTRKPRAKQLEKSSAQAKDENKISR